MAATAFVFDLDGVVWDSHPWFARLLESLTGEPAAGFELRLRKGANIMGLIKDRAITKNRFLAEAAHRAGSLRLFTGVRETLDVLRQRQVPMGVASSLPAGLVMPILDALSLLGSFIDVVHAGNCRARKPSPIPILQAVAGMGIQPSRDVFYVGDRDLDGVAATRAGVSFAWAAYGYGHSPPLEHVVVNHFADILLL